jgi:hypothetical protein
MVWLAGCHGVAGRVPWCGWPGAVVRLAEKDLGNSVLGGRMGAVYDAFFSVKHESSAEITI